MSVATFEIRSDANNVKAIKEFNKINLEYSKLKNEVSKLVNNYFEVTEYKKKLNELVDLNPIRDQVNKKYIEGNSDGDLIFHYLTTSKTIIESTIENKCLNNNVKMEKYLNLNREILVEELEDLEIDTIGTTLNVMREFYSDLYNGLVRMKIITTESEKINFENQKGNRYKFYKMWNEVDEVKEIKHSINYVFNEKKF